MRELPDRSLTRGAKERECRKLIKKSVPRLRAAGTGSDEVLEELTVLPLREMVVYPLTTVPLTVGRPRSVRAIEQANQSGGAILLASQRDPDARPQTLDDFFPIGIRARCAEHSVGRTERNRC